MSALTDLEVFYQVVATEWADPGRWIFGLDPGIIGPDSSPVIAMHPLDLIHLQHDHAPDRLEPAIGWLLRRAHSKLDEIGALL